MLDTEAKFKLVDALLQCNTIQDQGIREIFIQELPSKIKDKTLRHANSRADTFNLIKTCLDYPDGIPQLLEKLYHYELDSTQFQQVQKIWVQLTSSSSQTGSPQVAPTINRPSYETAMPHNFDMNDLVEDCLEVLIKRRRGLTGFVLPFKSFSFISNFCERLRYELGRGRIYLKPPLAVDSINTPDRTIFAIKRQYLPPLKEKSILVAIQMADANLMYDFWDNLSQLRDWNKLDRRFIVIMSVPTDCEISKDINFLKPPRFRDIDVHRWVSQVVQNLGFPDHVIDEWVDLMILECSYKSELLIDPIFNHIEDILQVLQKETGHAIFERFQMELEQRKQYYA